MSSSKINGLHYFQTEDGVAEYHMFLDNNLIFKVYAFENQAYTVGTRSVAPLSVATPDGSKVITTGGRGVMKGGRASTGSVRSYVRPRVAKLMARLYVPNWM